MAVTQITTCDGCNTELETTSVLDCIILTHRLQDGTVIQSHYGLKCGCAEKVQAAISTLEVK
jgi:hypothetical protein